MGRSLYQFRTGKFEVGKVKHTLLVGLGLVLVIAVAILVYFDLGLPFRWQLPPGYKGWVVVRYGDPSCQPVEQHGLFLVLKVPEDGVVCVSGMRDRKRRHHSFVYASADSAVTEVESFWGTSIVDSEGVLDMWFVGTEAELKESGYRSAPQNRHEALSGKK